MQAQNIMTLLHILSATICQFINLLFFLMEIIYLDLHTLNLGEKV